MTYMSVVKFKPEIRKLPVTNKQLELIIFFY